MRKVSAGGTGLRYRADDGIALAADAWGAPDRPTVILLHGGGQTRHAWKKTARLLAEKGFHAISADLRGHGDSEWSPDGIYTLERFVADLRRIAATCRQPPALIGASLGGITGLLAEGEGPAFLASLILVDVTPTVQDSGVEKIRRFMGARAAAGFGSIEEAAASIAAYLPHRPRPHSLAGLAKNLRRHADGRYRWHWDPALLEFSDRALTAQLSPRLVAAARQLAVPVLLVRGGSSDLVTVADAKRFLELVPHARYLDIANAQHMVAGDDNDQFGAAVLDFLGELCPGIA